MGQAQYVAWKGGAFDVKDPVGRTRNPRWGTIRYERSLADILRADEPKKYKTASIDRSAISERMNKRWADAKDRRIERERQLADMSDRALAAEVYQHRWAEWNQSKLLEHVKDHQRDYALFFGHPVGPKEIEEISKLVMRSWDRLFTSIEIDGMQSYTFAADWSTGKVLLTVTRTGKIRTMIPAKDLQSYLGRHPELVEVTERVRRIGV